MGGQTRMVLAVGHTGIRVRIVEETRSTRIEWWRHGLCMDRYAWSRRGLCVDRYAWWQLIEDRDLNSTDLSAKAHSRILARRCAAETHADDSRA
jgi:hypothetical protein